LQDCIDFAKNRDLALVSTEYLSNNTQLIWKCKNNHKFKRNMTDMLRGSGKCGQCYGRGSHSRMSEEKLDTLLNRRGYSRVFEYSIYKNESQKMPFIHKKCGNQLSITVHDIKSAHWQPCHHCSNVKPGSLEECIELAKKKEGKCVRYSGFVKVSSVWKCKNNHEWTCSLAWIRKGTWCPRCEYDSRIKNTESEIAFLNRRRSYIRDDKKKGLIGNLTDQDMLDLIGKNCVYCGKIASGYDRKDNSIGHLKENCVPCCQRCNRIKMHDITYKIMLKIGEVFKNENY